MTQGLDRHSSLLRPRPGSREGAFDLGHPLGLRALPELLGLGLGGETHVHAEVSVQHVLECRAQVEDALSAATGPTLVLALRGPLSFSDEELGRLAPGVPLGQLEAAVTLLLDWSRRRPSRLVADLGLSLVGLSPSSTPADLRKHLDGLRRHGLEVDPISSGAAGDVHIEDGDVAAIVASVREATSPRERMDRLARALDSMAGPARGAKQKHLRLLPSLRGRGRRPPSTHEVVLSRDGDPRPERQRAADAIVAVRAAARADARTVVLSGAEPAAEWYLDELVAMARSLGLAQVVLQTKAAGLDEPGRAASLASAGLTMARIVWTDPADPRTVSGARALLDAGLPVELVVDVVPGRPDELAHVVEQVSRVLPSSKARVEKVLARVARPASLSEAAGALVAGAGAAQRQGIAIEVAPGTELPPCVFDDVEAAVSVLRLSEGLVVGDEAARLHARIPLCDACGASHVCPGPLRGLESEVAAIGRRLPAGARGIPPTEERRQVLQELRSVILRKAPDGGVREMRVVRINFHCNQACDFCFVSRQLPPPEEALIEQELVDAARVGASLAISGGEPTINARLPEYIARAIELGITDLELQTNAVKMSDRAYAASLAAAGLPLAFVSLHGTTAATSDRVTAAPGTFGKTVEGIRNLLREGVAVRANFVVCGYNAAEFPELPDFVDRELRSIPGARLQVNFSFVAPSSNVPRDVALVPRFSQVAWALEKALARSEALGLPLVGFDSQCGVPPCFLPDRIRGSAFPEDLPEEELQAFAGSFRKSEACAKCSFTRRCYGVRAGYAEMYGTEELRPI